MIRFAANFINDMKTKSLKTLIDKIIWEVIPMYSRYILNVGL